MQQNSGSICPAGASSAKQGSSKNMGSLAFEEDEPGAVPMPGSSSSKSSKAGSSKLPEAFREDISGNDTFRQKASQGSLPGAAKTSNSSSSSSGGSKKGTGAFGGLFSKGASTLDEAELETGRGSSSSSSKKGSSGSKSAADSMTDYDEEAELEYGSSKGSKADKSQPGSTVSRGTSGSTSDADSLETLDERTEYSSDLGGRDSKVTCSILCSL